MRYLSKPRWRWLLFLPIAFLAIPLGLLTLATLTCFKGIRLWNDLMNWAMYEKERE